jgi:hypothetical protein
VFYALPFLPTTYQVVRTRFVVETRNGIQTARHVVETVKVFTIGKETIPFGGQTLYRIGATPQRPRDRRREDVPIAKWTRDTPDGQFRLSIMSDDYETRLKLKSIVPVLERAEHGR